MYMTLDAQYGVTSFDPGGGLPVITLQSEWINDSQVVPILELARRQSPSVNIIVSTAPISDVAPPVASGTPLFYHGVPLDQQVPVWDADLEEWIPQTPASGSGGTTPSGLFWVTPEQFADSTHTTDDEQFAAAINAVAPTGGVVVLQPGKTYTWVQAPATFDFSVYKKEIIVQAWGAIINANYAGAAWTIQGNTGNTNPNSLIWLGGNINNSVGDGITLNDSGKAFFFRAAAGCPNGSAWVAANVTAFSENHHWMECYDNNSKHAISLLRQGSAAGSFARTVIRSLRTQGGVPGEAKINIGDNTAFYGGLIDGISGNLQPGSIVVRIAGNMHGTIIQGNMHLEVSMNAITPSATWTSTSSFITCASISDDQAGWAVSGTGISGFVGDITPGVGFVLSSSSVTSTPVNPSGSGTNTAITITPGPAYYFTVGALSGGQRATLIAPVNFGGSTMGLMHPSSPSPDLYGVLNAGYGVATGPDVTGTQTTSGLAVGQCANFTLPNGSPVALPATTETVVFTINVTPGEYILQSSLCVNFTTASTASNVQTRITGGTATYSVTGQPTAQQSSPSAANTTNQTVQAAIHAYLTVTASGTLTVTARASSVASVLGTATTFGNASGYILQRVA